MIRMIRGDGGIGPRVVCDHCGEIIQDGRDAHVLWEVDVKGIIVSGRPSMVHHVCARPFAEEHAVGYQWQQDELSVFPARLATALHLDGTTPAESDTMGVHVNADQWG